MARYKKRKDGLYQARIKVGFNPTTGAPKFKSVYARSINELEIKKAEIKSAVNKGIYADDRNILLGEWASDWYDLERSQDSPKTKEMYKNIVFSHIRPSLGHIKLRDLKRSEIQAMINSRWEHPRICAQIIMCLNQILNAAIDEGYLYKNVCKNIKRPSYRRTPQRPLTEDEKFALFHAPFTSKQKTFLYILYYLGLRREEVLALRKNMFDLKQRTLKISSAITFDGNTPVIKEPKTENSYRELLLPFQLCEQLKSYFKEVDDLLFAMEKPNLKLEDQLQRRLMSKTSYYKFWKQILNTMNAVLPLESQIENLTSRIFHYNFATMLYYSGVDLKEAQYLMGHSDISLTLNIYTALDSKQADNGKKYQEYLDKTERVTLAREQLCIVS